MTGGKNGATPFENLAHIRSKPVYAEAAELEHSKCLAHPTKRMWTSDVEAMREAEARTIAAKMQIVAYRCDSCGNAHLCKATSARPGSILLRDDSIERVELPGTVVPGNADAKRKVLMEYLNEHPAPTTTELMALLGLKRAAIGKYMGELGWYNTRGAAATWKQRTAKLTAVDKPVDSRPPANFEVFKGKGMSSRNLKALDESQSRHPSAQNAGWRPMENLERIRHMPIGDLLDTFMAAGMEVRIQVR